MPGTRPYMTDTAVDTAVGVALDRLFESEGELPPDVHERTIAGFYARHLERVLRERRSTTAGRRNSGWSVDCEYNRLGLDPKRVPDLDVMFREVAAGLGWPPDAFTAGDTGLVVPDVVVHRRQSGIGAGNLIVCELRRITASKEAIAADLVKLAACRLHIKYEHAFLILLGETRDACVVHRASTELRDIVWYVQRLEEAAAIRRWKKGHAAAAQRQRSLLAAEGPRPVLAVAELLSALNALYAMGMWPGPRDQQVRRRWAQVQHRAKQARTR